MQIPGQRIRDFRESRGWSTNDLARACNMRESFLLDIEDGNIVKIHPRTYQKIADALNLTLGMLNGDEDIPENASIYDEIPEKYRFLIKIILILVVVLGVITTVFITFSIFLAVFLWIIEHV